MKKILKQILKLFGKLWVRIATYIVLVAIVILIFIWLTYSKLIDAYVIEDHIFLQYFSVKMLVFALFGYFIASICFFIYLFLADKAHQLDKDKKEEEKVGILDDQKQNAYLSNATVLKSTFDYSFIFSALILSVFIVWLGVMFKAINSMELMEYYLQISGNYYLNNDYVYLVGILHSLLLLIFYIPVQLKFNSLNIIIEQQQKASENLQGLKKVFSGFFSNFSSVLLTASPLLTSFVQDLATSFLGS